MSVLISLAREHRLFLRLSERLERAMRYGEKTAREELRGGLLALLYGLDRHEQIEDEVFTRSAFASSRGARRMLAEVERQHVRINELKDRTLKALAGSDVVSLAGLGPVVIDLSHELRRHFATEETRLWPLYSKIHSRSLDYSVTARAERAVNDLERELRKFLVAASDYVGGPR